MYGRLYITKVEQKWREKMAEANQELYLAVSTIEQKHELTILEVLSLLHKTEEFYQRWAGAKSGKNGQRSLNV